MSMELTLFGGMIAVVLLFALARGLRLAPEMAGLVSAGLPLLAYTIYLFRHWPGLDVVSIHIALFASAAFVMTVFSRYRSRQSRMHWVPKALIGFFVVLAAMNAGFLYVATKGLPGGLVGLFLPVGENQNIHTGFAGTTHHGPEAARAVGADLSREHRNLLSGWEVRVEGLRQPVVGENAVFVRVEDEQGISVTGLQGAMSLSRPGGAPERHVLVATGQGQYETRLNFGSSGLWLLELRMDEPGGGSYRQAWEINLP